MVGGFGGLFGDDEEYESGTNKASEVTEKNPSASEKNNDVEGEAASGFGGLFGGDEPQEEKKIDPAEVEAEKERKRQEEQKIAESNLTSFNRDITQKICI